LRGVEGLYSAIDFCLIANRIKSPPQLTPIRTGKFDPVAISIIGKTAPARIIQSFEPAAISAGTFCALVGTNRPALQHGIIGVVKNSSLTVKF
jgi:hypothetical protein